MSSLRCGAESEGRAWGAFRIDAPVHRRAEATMVWQGWLAHRAMVVAGRARESAVLACRVKPAPPPVCDPTLTLTL